MHHVSIIEQSNHRCASLARQKTIAILDYYSVMPGRVQVKFGIAA